jgi:hypothetical protein
MARMFLSNRWEVGSTVLSRTSELEGEAERLRSDMGSQAKPFTVIQPSEAAQTRNSNPAAARQSARAPITHALHGTSAV